jgi:uncharacterized protein YggE
MSRYFTPVALLACLLLVAPVAAQSTHAPGIISLTGTGEVSGTPDMATISSGVVTHGKIARIALDANTFAMNEIFALLQSTGIEQKDIQTSGFSVQPQYNYSDQRDANGYPLPPRISGYQVSNTLTIHVRNLDNLGALLDSSVSVGANQINSITFSVTDTAPLYNNARRAAMADAFAKAELYAQAAGVTLGNIISISEGSPVSLPQPEMVMMARMAEAPTAVPVAAGELGFSKQISVVWELVQE